MNDSSFSDAAYCSAAESFSLDQRFFETWTSRFQVLPGNMALSHEDDAVVFDSGPLTGAWALPPETNESVQILGTRTLLAKERTTQKRPPFVSALAPRDIDIQTLLRYAVAA